MRNLKKFLALVLAMMMVMSLMLTVNAKNVEFSDDETITEVFKEDLTVLAGMKVVKGYAGNNEDGQYKPQGDITRAEMAAIVYRLATGDVDDKQTDAYVGASNFLDVKDDAWYAGYVNYCENSRYIAGDGKGYFRPTDKVTGYEALAMLLRAMGYNEPDHNFTGSNWATTVLMTARPNGMLAKVDKTSYASRLSLPATRELVAELAFQTAIRPQVQWTLAFGYQDAPLSGVIGGDEDKYPSLGEANFGLTSTTGIVLGNQATGEDNTLLSSGGGSLTYRKGDDSADATVKYSAYAYPGTELVAKGTTDTTAKDAAVVVPDGLEFKTETGLDMFGHNAEVWYNANSGSVKTAYAVFDRAKLATYVYAEDEDLSVAAETPAATDALLGRAAAAAGFNVQLSAHANNTKATVANTTANVSDRYSQLDTSLPDAGTKAATAAAESPVNMYYLVSNNSGKTVDVVVSLSAEVGKITELNTTAKNKYLTLGTDVDNASLFSNDTTKTDRIYLDCLTPGSVQKIGEIVTAWQVVGTSFDATAAAAIDGTAAQNSTDVMYQLDAMKTETKTVSSFVKDDTQDLDANAADIVTKVNFTDGTSMELSGITLGDKTNSKIISKALPIVNTTNYTTGNDDTSPNPIDIQLKAGVAYTVYVDVLGRFISMTTGSDLSFLYGTFADFEIGALGTGTSKYVITGVDENGGQVINHDLISIDGAAIDGSAYSGLDITRKEYGTSSGNEITEGENTGYMIDGKGNLTTYTGSKMVDTDKWTISSAEVAMGVSRVTSNSVDYLLTEDTQFYVVEGSGSATLKVTPYKGIKALLDGASSVEIAFATGDDEVVFWTEEDLYGTADTGKNHHVAKVILSDTNLTRWDAKNLFFSFAADTTGTGLVLPGASADVKQFKLYNDGKADYYFIDTSAALGGATSMAAKTFYTLMPCDEVNGQTIYKAVAQTAKTDLSYIDGFNTGVTYHYVAVNNLNFANLTKGAGDLIFGVGNATICDVHFKETAAQADVRSEITNLAELNNAISVKESNLSGGVYTVEVAVVYDNNNVAVIYITDVT